MRKFPSAPAVFVLTSCAMVFALRLGAQTASEGSGLTGKWTLDPAESSSIKPWEVETLTLSLNAQTVTLVRDLNWDRDRQVTDTTTVNTDGRTETANPVKYWLDPWYTNVYIGGDHTARTTGAWLEGGRILKVETSVVLDAQQGDHPVHLYEEYRLSADGRTLRLFELRSSRDQALSFVFHRD